MPEVPIAEDREFAPEEDDVWSARQLGNVKAITQPRRHSSRRRASSQRVLPFELAPRAAADDLLEAGTRPVNDGADVPIAAILQRGTDSVASLDFDAHCSKPFMARGLLRLPPR